MKTVSVRDFQKNVKDSVDASQNDKVVITRHGRPAAVLIGVEGEGWEDVVLKTSNQFWKEIAKRRKEKTISLAEIGKKYGWKQKKRSK